jgi:hypothetical protein
VKTTSQILSRLNTEAKAQELSNYPKISENYTEEKSVDKGNMSKMSNLNDSVSTQDSVVKRIQAMEQVDIIKEANKIMRERSKNGSNTVSKYKAKIDYIGDNREICLKNYLIDLLKDKRTEINDRELAITKALKESENKLERDYKDFLSYVEKEKNRAKEQEQEYLYIKNTNDYNKKNEKTLVNENGQILGDLERNVKVIQGSKSLAMFVHSVVSVPFLFTNGVENEMKNSDQRDKDKNIERLTNKLIDDFSKIDLDEYFPEFLYDTAQLTGKFLEPEENVLKLMEKKHNMDKELKLMDEKHHDELEELKKREIQVKEEKVKLLREREKDSKILGALKTLNFEGDSHEYLNYIMELFAESHVDDIEIKPKKKADNRNYLKELIDTLRQKEIMVINFISEMEGMEEEDETLFKALVTKRKEKNKETKQRMKVETQANRKLNIFYTT